jgi:hypothetical protein
MAIFLPERYAGICSRPRDMQSISQRRDFPSLTQEQVVKLPTLLSDDAVAPTHALTVARYYWDRFGVETVCIRIGYSWPAATNTAR